MPVPLLNKPFSKWAQANIGVCIHLQEDFCVCSLPIKLVNIFCVVCRMPVGIINLGIPQCPFLHFAKSRVQVTSASEKSRLASVGRIFKFRGKKAHKQLMHKAFSLWHLYCLRVLAEMERFELSIPFWGIHDFQSCALDQLRDISMALIIPDFFIKVNRNFGQPQGNAPPIIKLDKVF